MSTEQVDFIRGRPQEDQDQSSLDHKRKRDRDDNNERTTDNKQKGKREGKRERREKKQKNKKSTEGDAEPTLKSDDKDLFTDDYKLLKQKKSKLYDPNEADKDGEEGEDAGEKKGKKLPKDYLSKKQEQDAKKLLPFLKSSYGKDANRLMFKNFYTGLVVVGCLESISNMDLTFSLPFGAKGYVKFNEISDEFTKYQENVMKNKEIPSSFIKLDTIMNRIKGMFMIGQFMKLGVVGLTDNAKSFGLHCTLRPDIVNSGSTTATYKEGMTIYGEVKSVEDRGYIVSFGKDIDAKGFIENTHTSYFWPVQGAGAEWNKNECRLSQGQPFEAVIQEIDEATNTFKLNASHLLINRSTVTDSSVITMDSIKAGMMVETKVAKIYRNGIAVTFLDYFAGDIFYTHLEKPLSEYKVDQSLKARILYVDQIDKKIGLSCLSHVLGLKPYPFGQIKPGTIIKSSDVTINRVDQLEMFVVINSQPALKGYIHKNKIPDLKADNLRSKYQMNTKLDKDCRIIHVDHVDALVTLTLRQAELSKEVYNYYNLFPGMSITGVIKIIRPDSLEVEVGPSIFGVVPKHNIADTILSDPSKKFKVGQTVKCRVLSCQPQHKRLMLTMKQSLINSTLPIFVNMNQVNEGDISHGYISNIKDNSHVFVSFYDKCFGIVQKKDLANVPITMIEDHFKIGQVVTAQVIGKNKFSLDLSFVISNLEEQLEIKQEVKEEDENEVDGDEEDDDDEEVEVKKEDEEMSDQQEEDDDDEDEEDDGEEVEVKKEDKQKQKVINTKQVNNKNNTNIKNDNSSNNKKQTPIKSTPSKPAPNTKKSKK